jgi:hypothetical protein
VSVASNKFTNAAGNQNTDGSDANNSKTLSVDTVVPTLILSADKLLLKTGATATIAITLSESSTDFAAADLDVTGGTLSSFSGSGTSYSVTFTPNAPTGTVSVASGKFSDAAGNQNADGSDANNALAFTYDTTPPTIAVATDKTSLKAGESATLTFTLSEASADFVVGDLTATGGVLSGFAGSGTSYTVSFTPEAESTTNGVVSVASNKFSDPAGNLNADGVDANNTQTLSVNTVKPTIAVTADKSSVKAGETAVLTFTLSQAATDFALEDVTFSGGTVTNFAGTGTSYTATFTPTANSTASGVVSVASNKFTNAAGNQNTDGSDANNSKTLSVDTVLPTLILSADKLLLKTGATATIAITLSESSTDFAVADLDVTGGTFSGFSGSGTSYSVTFTPNAPTGSVSVASGKFSDAAGNQNADGSDANNALAFTYDTTPPTISVATDKTSLKAGESATLTFTLSEASADFVVLQAQAQAIPLALRQMQKALTTGW